MDPRLRDATYRWIADDVDPSTRSELQQLLASAMTGSETDLADLTDRMSGMPGFGTAGIRGPVRAGPNGMNRAVVVRTTAGIASWLKANGRHGIAVVGRDARHGSADFAQDAAGVFAAEGFEVRMLPEPLPTPVLAHTVRALGAVAGVQITASHNPPQDNGYKLYLDEGTQLVGPADSEIMAAIERAPASASIPRHDSWTTQHTALDDYLSRVASLTRTAAREVRIVATALHGVGAKPLLRALNLAGFDDVHLVPTQSEPDPEFPTVRFPNPEEPGATDALLGLAAEVDADLAIALDPDADRCAIGVRETSGTWRMLRGDETGVLLGEHLMSTLDYTRNPDPLVATTIVSATMLRRIAEEHRVRYDETLTGFKWLVRAGDGAGSGLIYAYEEALGHCVDPDFVRDKDGISAAIVACDLAATGKRAGRTLPDMLDALSLVHGVHETGQVSIRVDDLSVISATMRRLRSQPPSELAGAAVELRDLLPDADVLVLTGDGMRIVIRPSGTEPKLKCYLQVVAHCGQVSLESAKREAADYLNRIRSAVTELVSPRTAE